MPSEMYDFCSLATPDYNYTLVIKAQGTVLEDTSKNQSTNLADDDTEEVITHSDKSIFWVSWDWSLLTEANSGIIFDLYHDNAKAKGIARTFKWLSYDGHTYVVRFDCKLKRTIRLCTQFGISGIVLKIKGRIAD